MNLCRINVATTYVSPVLSDAKALAEKKAAKEALKTERLSNDPHGNATAFYEAADARKEKQKADKKERSKEVGQAAKQNRSVLGKA